MTWARIDDGLYDDPRARRAGVDAMGLYVLAASYMGRYNTDGVIDRERVKLLVGRRGPYLAAKLVDAGLWTETDTGWCLLEWEAVLVPRAEVERRSAGARAAGAKGGRQKAERSKPAPNPTDSPEQPADEPPRYVRDTPRDNPSDKSPVQNANSAKEKRTELPTPAHDPEPDPVPDSARVRADVQDDHRGPGEAPIPPRPTLADLAVPPAPDPPRQPAEKRDSTQQGLFGEEEQLAEPAKKGTRVRGHDVATVAEQVHAAHVEAWRAAERKGHEPVMNAKRRKLVEARLADGYAPERLCAAVRGILAEGSWHRDNGFADIDHALKDGAAVEKFEKLVSAPKEPKPEPYRAPRPELPPGAKPVDWNEWQERLRRETGAWNARRAQEVSRG